MLGAGKRARGSVMAVYELLGGDTAMKNWAALNKSEFYTKLFGKMISKEVEHKVDDSVEDLLDRLDGRSAPALEARVVEAWPVVDAEFAPIVVGDDPIDDDDDT